MTEPITFHKDPAKFTAIFSYMGGQVRRPKWDLYQGRYKNWGFQEQAINNNIKSICIDEISLKNNYNSKILCQIINITFPFLKALNLQGNNITSIENIQKLNFPSIVRIDLTDNCLITVKALRKISTNTLQQLALKNNHLNELQKISEIPAKNMKEIVLQTYLTNKAQTHCLRFSFKLQTNALEWLVASNSQRIPFSFSKIEQKYSELCLRVYRQTVPPRQERVRRLIRW